MPRYYFSIRNPRSGERPIHDQECPDLPSAIVAGQQVAHRLVRRLVRAARNGLHGDIEVKDERREAVARILLADVARAYS